MKPHHRSLLGAALALLALGVAVAVLAEALLFTGVFAAVQGVWWLWGRG